MVLGFAMTDRCYADLRTALFAFLSAALLVGCATPEETSKPSPYDSEPFATRPHLKMSWRQALNPPQPWEYRPRQYSTPHYRKSTDEMYVGTDRGTVFKIRGGDGKVLWREQLQGSVHAEPTYGDGRVYVGTLEGYFYALDEATGDVIWAAQTDGSIESRAAFAEGRIFYTTSNDVLVAADAATGKRLWNYRRTAPEYFTIKETAKPVVEDATVYCGFADGVMVALQIDTGEMLWSSDLSAGKTEFIDADEDPVIAGSRLYAASYDGGLYAIDKMSGDHIWRRPLEGGIADFVYGEDTLYVGTANGRLVAVDAEDGRPRWGFKFDDYTPAAITATPLYLFVSTSSGPVYVIDRHSGFPLMSWDPSSGFNTRVIIGAAAGFAISNRGYLYGFDVAY
jgi:outer membrane protein assembly factor BamB